MIAAIGDIVASLIESARSDAPIDLAKAKIASAERHGLLSLPRTVDVIAAIPPQWQRQIVPHIRAKPVRTASGVAVVAVMSKPHRCPHIATTGGRVCVYCPGGPDSDFEYSSQSYTGYEPTSMRAIRARYNPYVQARHRVEQLERLGHCTDKVEFILMGGTFMALDVAYRDYFIRSLHDALSGHLSASVAEAVAFAEHARSRCVALTIETRPDFCKPAHLSQMLAYGCTRLEVGVQSVYEDVARDTNRGHSVEDVATCFCDAKDAGFKIVAHLMPDLPNVDYERDLASFRELFENPAFRVDGLKIYPTLVLRGTGLYELWRAGRYVNYHPDELVELLAVALAMVPPWVRIYRIQRDIPMPLVSSGVKYGNLRELVLARMDSLGLRCRDIRTREVGIRGLQGTSGGKKAARRRAAAARSEGAPSAAPRRDRSAPAVRPHLELVRRDYVANGGGWETFLSYEDPETDTLVGLARLRKPSPDRTFRPELQPAPNVSILRELHVYGNVVAVSERGDGFQHRGLGMDLMAEAERIAKREHGAVKMAVISGVGTRNYYRKLGYVLEGAYMCKDLTASLL